MSLASGAPTLEQNAGPEGDFECVLIIQMLSRVLVAETYNFNLRCTFLLGHRPGRGSFVRKAGSPQHTLGTTSPRSFTTATTARSRFHYPRSSLAAMEDPFVFDRAWEFLDPATAPQLRLVSRSFRDALAALPRKLLRVEDYLSSVSLFLWARRELRMPERADIADMAAWGGHLDLLKWLRAEEGRCSWTPSICASAAEQGHLHVLKWLRSQSPPCPWDEDTCNAAASRGRVEVLQWLRAQDPPCPWTSNACVRAAGGGHLVVLQWLRAQNPPCPWHVETCGFAADEGHLEVLQWMRAQDPLCPWDEGTSAGAAHGGHLKVLQWLRAQGCDVDERACSVHAAMEGHVHVLQWLRAENPPRTLFVLGTR
jgi:hypothetical protein